MSMNGIGGAVNTIRLPQTAPAGRVEQDPALQPQQTSYARPAAAPAPTAPQTVEPSAKPAQSVPLEAPPGTDPELWSVLSTEERKFFAKVGAMGPLTYGHLLKTGQADAPVARGGRLDVKA